MFGTFPYAADPYGDAPIGGTTAYPLTLSVKRAVLEVIGSNDVRSVRVNRLVVEVIGEDSFVPGDTEQTVSRLAVEVIHSLAEAPGKLLAVSRAVLEVIASAAYLGVGLRTVPVSVLQPTIFLAFNSAGSGSRLQFVDNSGRGLSLTVNGSTLSIQYTDGSRKAVATAPDVAGTRVLAFSAGATASAARIWLDNTALTVTPTGTGWGYVDLFDLNESRDPLWANGGSISELMVYPQALTDARIGYLRQYFDCKWRNPGCNVYSDLPAAP